MKPKLRRLKSGEDMWAITGITLEEVIIIRWGLDVADFESQLNDKGIKILKMLGAHDLEKVEPLGTNFTSRKSKKSEK